MDGKENKFVLKFTTLVFPAFIFLLSLVLVFVSVNSVKKERTQELTAKLTNGEFDFKEKIAYFNNQQISAPKLPFKENRKSQVLSVTNPDEKWIEIDLANQRLKAHEGDRVVYDFLISSGKWGRTPTGEFRIWIKLKYTKMSGGSRAIGTYYYLPNVPYTQYFHNGYGLHGTYWHNNFGHPMSHGCINMKTEEAEKIFYWTHPSISSQQRIVRPTKQDKGTRVIVHGEAPWE